MNQGFTLIELLVVILIIGILSAVALPQYQTAVERSRATEALTQMNAISTSMQRYHAQRGSFPSSFSQLDVEIPTRACDDGSTGCYGGKYFIVSINGSAITAERYTGTTSGGYSLTTTITPSDDDAYTVTRTCDPEEGNSEAEDYCNAITGGHNTDF